MYCPNCAAPIEGVKFCRNCGANVSLVSQAMTGELPKEPPQPDAMEHAHDWRHRSPWRRDKEPSMASGIQTAFMGLGFLFVAIAVSRFAPAGHLWWFWLLIPTFAMLGKGVAEIVQARQAQALPPPQTGRPLPTQEPARNTNEFPAQSRPAQINAPDSIVEGTTRHLDPTARRSDPVR